MANKTNNADPILTTFQFAPLSKSNASEVTITVGLHNAIERADSPVREINYKPLPNIKTYIDRNAQLPDMEFI